jgi:hypothetical protein
MLIQIVTATALNISKHSASPFLSSSNFMHTLLFMFLNTHTSVWLYSQPGQTTSIFHNQYIPTDTSVRLILSLVRKPILSFSATFTRTHIDPHKPTTPPILLKCNTQMQVMNTKQTTTKSSTQQDIQASNIANQ